MKKRPSSDKIRILQIIINILVLIMLMIMVAALTLTIQKYDNIENNLNRDFISLIEKYKLDQIKNGAKGDNGYTPIKGIDYDDGEDAPTPKNGENGKDSVSTHTKETIIEKENVVVEGKPGENGLTPVMRCNESKNWWEVSYDAEHQLYNIVLNEKNEPAKCVAESKE